MIFTSSVLSHILSKLNNNSSNNKIKLTKNLRKNRRKRNGIEWNKTKVIVWRGIGFISIFFFFSSMVLNFWVFFSLPKLSISFAWMHFILCLWFRMCNLITIWIEQKEQIEQKNVQYFWHIQHTLAEHKIVLLFIVDFGYLVHIRFFDLVGKKAGI